MPELPFNVGQQPGYRDWYVYRTLLTSLANTASDTTTINIRSYADFVVYKLMMFADIAGAVQTDSSRVIPLITLQITDTGSGANFFNNPLPLGALFGSGSVPHILPGPRRIAANSTLQFSWYNYSAATTYANIYLVMEGVEVQKR